MLREYCFNVYYFKIIKYQKHENGLKSCRRERYFFFSFYNLFENLMYQKYEKRNGLKKLQKGKIFLLRSLLKCPHIFSQRVKYNNSCDSILRPGVQLQHSSYNFSSSRLKSEPALPRKNERSDSYSPRIFNAKRTCLFCFIKVYTLQSRIAATKVSFRCWRRMGRRRTLDLTLP